MSTRDEIRARGLAERQAAIDAERADLERANAGMRFVNAMATACFVDTADTAAGRKAWRLKLQDAWQAAGPAGMAERYLRVAHDAKAYETKMAEQPGCAKRAMNYLDAADVLLCAAGEQEPTGIDAILKQAMEDARLLPVCHALSEYAERIRFCPADGQHGGQSKSLLLRFAFSSTSPVAASKSTARCIKSGPA